MGNIRVDACNGTLGASYLQPVRHVVLSRLLKTRSALFFFGPGLKVAK